jgi:homoserine dehydrogenase
MRGMATKTIWRLGFAGFGNVHKALARLLLDRRDELLDRFGLEWRATLVATRRQGAVVDDAGLDLEALLSSGAAAGGSLLRALEDAPIDLLFEGTTLDPHQGEPATSHVRAALGRGVAVVSANKGPLAFAARELMALARERRCGFRFESAVADCLPLFDLIETALPVGRVLSFEGVLNATSNRVLGAVLQGGTIEAAVKEAQRIGVAEADPSNDLDGWDQAVKAVIVSNVLCGADLRPKDVERTPLKAVDLDWARREERKGRAVRLAASGGRGRPARVAAVAAPAGSFLATLGGESLGIGLETEPAGTFRVASLHAGVVQTAYGQLTDFVAIHQGRLQSSPPGAE